MYSSARRGTTQGFTLIELSIVLVIVGLIVGGILTGRDLIDAAAIRAQISQIEKYHTAVRTFQNKYGYLPGDIPNPAASNFGFPIARGSLAGEGDGNGILEGNCNNTAGSNLGIEEGCGETLVFWQDLNYASLVDGFSASGGAAPSETTNTAIYYPAVLPASKLASSIFVYTYSTSGTNYFGISSASNVGWFLVGGTDPGLSVVQAYNIDKKTDDGMPQSGSVTACYLNGNISTSNSIWAAGAGNQGANGGTGDCLTSTTATAYATTNCYDNNNVAGVQTYSLKQNATKPNCALSFRFQ
ncbi:MAG TPA: prepilin-type N-terminal cleavage/methylation domain-containing protein [Rickettsiales bacterium]|nr:prepilin-type N-terminal cleavage/methylation domain-containing protein [Rickettsiales bacterium]